MEGVCLMGWFDDFADKERAKNAEEYLKQLQEAYAKELEVE